MLLISKISWYACFLQWRKVVDTTNHETLYENAIPHELAVEVLKYLGNFPVVPMIDDGNVLYVTDKNAYRVREEALNDSMNCVEVSSLIDCLDFPLIRFLLRLNLRNFQMSLK